jgi:hypothetical protein
MDEDAIAQFAGITGSMPTIAAQYLRLAENNTEQAIELYFANDGAGLEPSSAPLQSSDPPPVPSSSTRPPGHRRGHEDEEGVVHLDSDPDDDDFIDDDDDVQITGQTSRPGTAVGRSTPALHTPSTATPPNGPSRTVDDDEAMARRMQEEIYGAAGTSGGHATKDLDEHGYRAPIGRTTETLVGPDTFDPSNADEMRAAVMQQMAARRQQPRNRGKPLLWDIEIMHRINRYRPTWYLQPSHSTLDLE